eukprot:15461040-Alexandrium_andersonii.AAC.1
MATCTCLELPRARFCAVARAGCGGGIDNVGSGGRTQKSGLKVPQFRCPTFLETSLADGATRDAWRSIRQALRC